MLQDLQRMEQYMAEALREADLARRAGDIPVGAVVVHNGEVIARGHNLREAERDPLGHAECIAIARAAEYLGDWRLTGCELYVTLEPCPMCAGAILNARLERLVFGAYDKNWGCAGGKCDLFTQFEGVKTKVYGGVSEQACTAMLSEFFRDELRQI